MLASSPPPPSASSPSVPQPRPCAHNVPCRTSTAGHQPRSTAASVPCRAPTARRKICQIERQKGHTICQKNCQKDCQTICQEGCQSICQKECQKECQKGCQKYCQKICQNASFSLTTNVLEHALLNCTWTGANVLSGLNWLGSMHGISDDSCMGYPKALGVLYA